MEFLEAWNAGVYPWKGARARLRRAFAGFHRDLANHATKPYTPTSIYTTIHIHHHSKPTGIGFPGVAYYAQIILQHQDDLA
jgi:hypothetical protein